MSLDSPAPFLNVELVSSELKRPRVKEDDEWQLEGDVDVGPLWEATEKNTSSDVERGVLEE